MRKFLSILSLLGLFACTAHSAGDILINTFGGMNSLDNPASLQPYESSDLLNVNIQPGLKAVFKRDGYGLFQTLTFSSAPVHGGYHFQQTGGGDVQLWGNATKLNSIVNDASAVVIATGTDTTTWQCTDNLGFAYCLTSNNDTAVKTDGSTANTTYQPTIPLGTMVTSTPLRLVVAGVSGSASTLNFSAENTFTNFTSGPLNSDPFTEVINAPGSRLTHTAYYFGKTFWWKDQSFGFAQCVNQYNCPITTISNQIGTLDNSSAFWNGTTFETQNNFSSGASPNGQMLGGIFFRGQDNHIYLYDGYALTRITRVITPTVTSASRKKANSWTQTSLSDFSGGASLYIDTTTSSGNVQLLGYHDSFSSLSNWTLTHLSGSNFSVSGGVVSSNCSAAGDTDVMVTNAGLVTYSSTTIYESTRFAFNNATAGQQNIELFLGPALTSGSSPASYSVSANRNAGTITFTIGKAQSTIATGSTAVADTSYHILSIRWLQNGGLTGYYDGVSKVSTTDTQYTVPQFSSATVRCQQTSAGGPYNCSITNFDETTSTGTYYSAVNNAPNLTSWGTLSETDSTVSPSTITYYVRASTGAFTVLSSTPSWTLQTKNANPNYSTGTYMQLRSEFAVTTATDAANASINDFTFNWNEGNASDKAYITYFNDGIWIAVSSGTGSTNNAVNRLDLLNNAWLQDNITANGFAIENNNLYFGDPTAGRIFKFGNVPTDNGTSIRSYWKSKDFTGDDPTIQNQFVQSDFIFAQSSNTVTYTYSLDQSAQTAINFTLYSSTNSIVERGFLLPSGRLGWFYNFQIGDTSGLPSWKLMMHKTHYLPVGWRPKLN